MFMNEKVKRLLPENEKKLSNKVSGGTKVVISVNVTITDLKKYDLYKMVSWKNLLVIKIL